MRLNFSTRFEKQRNKLQQSVKEKLRERIFLFEKEPFHTLLDNHPLKGEYSGCRSINITGDYRAIYFEEQPGVVRFIAIGSHSELYD